MKVVQNIIDSGFFHPHEGSGTLDRYIGYYSFNPAMHIILAQWALVSSIDVFTIGKVLFPILGKTMLLLLVVLLARTVMVSPRSLTVLSGTAVPLLLGTLYFMSPPSRDNFAVILLLLTFVFISRTRKFGTATAIATLVTFVPLVFAHRSIAIVAALILLVASLLPILHKEAHFAAPYIGFSVILSCVTLVYLVFFGPPVLVIDTQRLSFTAFSFIEAIRSPNLLLESLTFSKVGAEGLPRAAAPWYNVSIILTTAFSLGIYLLIALFQARSLVTRQEYRNDSPRRFVLLVGSLIVLAVLFTAPALVLVQSTWEGEGRASVELAFLVAIPLVMKTFLDKPARFQRLVHRAPAKLLTILFVMLIVTSSWGGLARTYPLYAFADSRQSQFPDSTLLSVSGLLGRYGAETRIWVPLNSVPALTVILNRDFSRFPTVVNSSNVKILRGFFLLVDHNYRTVDQSVETNSTIVYSDGRLTVVYLPP
jgi:hypothetical protein